jgi:hypothetical protein
MTDRPGNRPSREEFDEAGHGEVDVGLQPETDCIAPA